MAGAAEGLAEQATIRGRIGAWQPSDVEPAFGSAAGGAPVRARRAGNGRGSCTTESVAAAIGCGARRSLRQQEAQAAKGPRFFCVSLWAERMQPHAQLHDLAQQGGRWTADYSVPYMSYRRYINSWMHCFTSDSSLPIPISNLDARLPPISNFQILSSGWSQSRRADESPEPVGSASASSSKAAGDERRDLSAPGPLLSPSIALALSTPFVAPPLARLPPKFPPALPRASCPPYRLID